MNRYRKKRQEKLLASMNKKYTFTFTQQEVIAMCNAMGMSPDGSPREYRIGDGHILFGVLMQLQPIAAIATNIPEDEQGKQPAPEEPAFETEDAAIGTNADGDKENRN